MPPLIAAIPAALVAIGEAAAIGASLGTSLIIGAVTLALGTVSQLLTGHHALGSTGPARLNFGVDPTEPRRWCYGRGIIGGGLKYWETIGSSNADLWLVVSVHDTQCDAFETFYVNNVEVDFSSNAATVSNITLNGCVVTHGNPLVAVPSVTGLFAGQKIGSDTAGVIPGSTTITYVLQPTATTPGQIQLSNNPTGDSASDTITIKQNHIYCRADGTHPKMWKYDHLGTLSQAADAALVAASTGAGGTGAWSSTHAGNNVGYYVWHLNYDTGLYPNGIPQPLQLLRGRRIYDPRQDVAYGGVGGQTATDETTWTWSQNAALCLLDYLRGPNMNGKRIGGCGVPLTRVNVPSFIAAANICDQSVTLAAGGSEARYMVNGFVDSQEDKQQVVASMLQAMDAMLVLRDGQLYLIAGAAQTASLTLADDDLAGPLTVNPSVGRSGKINQCTSVYPDPSQLYAIVSAPPLRYSQYVTDDNGLELTREIRHRFTTSLAAVQRLNKLTIVNFREQLSIDATFKPVALQISAGDTFYWTSAAAGYSNVKMICTQRDLQEDGRVHIVARQETDTKYSWATTEEQNPPNMNVNQPLDPTFVPAPLLADVSVTGTTIAGETSSQVPALLLTINLPPSPHVLRVLTQYKLSSESTWKPGPTLDVQSAVVNGYIAGLSSGVAYDVGFAYQTAFGTSAYTTVSSTIAGSALHNTKHLVVNAVTQNSQGSSAGQAFTTATVILTLNYTTRTNGVPILCLLTDTFTRAGGHSPNVTYTIYADNPGPTSRVIATGTVGGSGIAANMPIALSGVDHGYAGFGVSGAVSYTVVASADDASSTTSHNCQLSIFEYQR